MKYPLFLIAATVSLASSSKAQNVGIGTTTPGTKLTIQANVLGPVMENRSTVSPVVIKTYINSTRAHLGTTSNHPFELMAGDRNGQLVLMPNGNVGIGISPESKFDVNGRIRVRQTAQTAGIGFDGIDASNNPIIDRGFVGMVNNDYMGIYGSGGAGWGMAMNVNNGNVGVGTTTPALGKLVVRGTAGSVSAMFGDNTAGVSIMNSAPSIGFNYYYSGGSKSINTGFGASVGVYDNTGQFFIATSATSVTGQGTAMPLQDRILIQPNGNVGIGITPASMLDVNGRIRIRQTTQTAGIGFDGKDASNNPQIDRGFIGMVNNDYVGFYGSSGAGWGMAMHVGTGNVGIGNVTPTNRLTVKDNKDFAAAAEIVQDGAGGGLWITSNGPSWATLTAVNNGTGPAIRTSGRVVVNASVPTSTLHVGGSITMPVKVINDNYTATADDYSIHFIPTASKGQLKTLTLPPAGGCTGRIYFISAALPFYRGAPEPSLLFIKDAAGNNIIANSAYNDTAEDGINALVHFKKDWGGGNTGPARRKLWITVQSIGTTWVVLAMDYYSE